MIRLAWFMLLAATAATAEPATGPVDGISPRIDAALAAGQLGVASELIERNAGELPAARIALARADYALAAGSLDEAAAGFTALTADPGMAARAQQGLGLTRLRQGQDAAAVVALDAALAANPGSIRGWIGRGVAADHQRDWPAADTAYARALALDPRSAAALTNRGYSKLLRGRFAEAAADSAAALAVDAKLAAAANNLRLARAMQGDYKAAFAGSTKVSLARDLNTVGFAAMTRGDYGVAETFFTRAMQTSPQFDRVAWDNLVYLKQLAHTPPGPGTPAK